MGKQEEITRQEFESSYSRRSNISEENYHKMFVTLPCKCRHEGCQGWAAISKNFLNIKSHIDLYAPSVDRYESTELLIEEVKV